MGLDTKYRPTKFADVLGQANTIKILRRFVSTGVGLRQSYLFAGSFGGGKTTLGRILARALLCDAPTSEGDPCDKCESCLSLLQSGTSVDFVEVDAATKSGKADMEKVTEEIQYATFSGRRRIYLFDECFTGETLLLTPDGPRQILELVGAKYAGMVWSIDIETGRGVWTRITNWFDQGIRETFLLIFDNGVELQVTENQLILTRNRGWVTASDLTSGDDVVEDASGGCQKA